jgi:Core-2/I-Branching enzyme
MTFYYVIGSYGPTWRLNRLVEHLNAASPKAQVVIMRDRKAPPLGALSANCEVHLTPRPVTWGDDSHLIGILDVLSRIRAKPSDWITLLSEQSYPIRHISSYERAVLETDSDCWLEQSITSNPNRDSLLNRYHSRSLQLPFSSAPRGRNLWLRAGRLINRLLPLALDYANRPGIPVRVRVPRRKAPFTEAMPLRMGSDWFAANGKAIARLLDPGHQKMLTYFCSTFLPSEAYIHTVLLAQSDLVCRDLATHFVKFEGAHPMELGIDEIATARKSGYWFARKLADPELLAILDGIVSAEVTAF